MERIDYIVDGRFRFGIECLRDGTASTRRVRLLPVFSLPAAALPSAPLTALTLLLSWGWWRAQEHVNRRERQYKSLNLRAYKVLDFLYADSTGATIDTFADPDLWIVSIRPNNRDAALTVYGVPDSSSTAGNELLFSVPLVARA